MSNFLKMILMILLNCPDLMNKVRLKIILINYIFFFKYECLRITSIILINSINIFYSMFELTSKVIINNRFYNFNIMD